MIRKQFTEVTAFYKEELHRNAVRIYIAFYICALIGLIVALIFGGGFSPEQILGFANAYVYGGSSTAAQTAQSASASGDGWLHYLTHNGSAALKMTLAGIIPFVPVLLLYIPFNGVMLGIIPAVAYLLVGTNPVLSFVTSVLPHALFELASFASALAIGLYIHRTITNLIRKREADDIKTMIVNSVRAFICIVIPLVLVAGIIEAYITPAIQAAFG